MNLDTIDTLAKGAFGMGTVGAVSNVPTPTGDSTDMIIKAAMQVLIAIVTIFSVLRNKKQSN